MKTLVKNKGSLDDAVVMLIESLHQKYAGVKTKNVQTIEDEDSAIAVIAPLSFSVEEVKTETQKECIRLEDKYNAYILPLVVQKTI